jgi:hypothetical protein
MILLSGAVARFRKQSACQLRLRHSGGFTRGARAKKGAPKKLLRKIFLNRLNIWINDPIVKTGMLPFRNGVSGKRQTFCAGRGLFSP